MNKASLNATITKIRAMHGRMLTDEDYRILSSKRSLAEVAQYLKEHPGFKELFADIDVNTVHRGYIEELLRKHDFEIFTQLRDFQHLGGKHFYNCVSERNDTEQLLSLITSIDRGEKQEFINAVPVYALTQSDLGFHKLTECRTIDELADELEHTEYAPLCAGIRRNTSGKTDILALETDFNTFYTKRLMASIKKELSKSDAALLTESVKAGVNIRNFINAYRMKAYFNASPEEIRRKMIPLSGGAADRRIEKLWECDSEEDMLRLMSKLPGVKQAAADSRGFIETAVTRVKLKYARKLMRTQSMPAVYYAFLQLCEIQTSNIIHIIEGIRYGLEPDRIEALITY